MNESIASLFEERYGIEKPSVIYNCTSAHAGFDRKKRHDIIREKLSLGHDRKIALFQGGYLPGRNLENLVLSSKHLKGGITLVFLGYGDYRKRLENLAGSCPPGQVRFIDAVSQNELLYYTSSADLGIIPYSL